MLYINFVRHVFACKTTVAGWMVIRMEDGRMIARLRIWRFTVTTAPGPKPFTKIRTPSEQQPAMELILLDLVHGRESRIDA